MKPKTFLGKFFNASLWINLLAMLAFVVACCFVAKLSMNIYTHHGETVIVPNVMHKPMVEARKALEEAGLVVDASDTAFVRKFPADCVLDQTPVAGKQVKPGRVVTLTVNASKAPTLSLPDIIDNISMREAMARLKSQGFKVGKPEFVKGERDWVYGVKVDGRHMFAGDRIPVEKEIILLVGDGIGLEDVDSVENIEEDIFEDAF